MGRRLEVSEMDVLGGKVTHLKLQIGVREGVVFQPAQWELQEDGVAIDPDGHRR